MVGQKLFFNTRPLFSILSVLPYLAFSPKGLHNLVPANGSVVPGQSGYISDYLQPLTNITQRLVAMKTKLIFGLTSAYLCDAGTDDIVLEVREAEGRR